MQFIVEWDHDKFLELCSQTENLYMVENVIIECLRRVYYPELTPESTTTNIVPWFWSHGAMALLVEVEGVFRIYFPKEETPAFTGLTDQENITVTDFAEIVQKKLNDTREGTAVLRKPSVRKGY